MDGAPEMIAGENFGVLKCCVLLLVCRESRSSTDTLFIVLVASIVFLMHAGFGMVCSLIYTAQLSVDLGLCTCF